MIRSLRQRRSDHGYVLSLTAMLLVPLLLAAAMAVDYGGWYAEASNIQKAADAAALAGVVWLPDLTKATSVAKDTAKKNGYDSSASNITITVTQPSTTRLKVSITNSAAPVYLARFIRSSTTITRTATAEWSGTTSSSSTDGAPTVGGKNYLGTGRMVTGSSQENFYLAINGYCSSTIAGDPFASRYRTTAWYYWPIVPVDYGACGSLERSDNPLFKPPTQPTYSYYIDIPTGRTTPIVLYAYSPFSPVTYDQTNAYTNIPYTYPNHGFGEMRTRLSTPSGSTMTCTGDSNPRAFDDSNIPIAMDQYPYADAAFWSTDGSNWAADVTHNYFAWERLCTIPTTATAGRYQLDVSVLGCNMNYAYGGCPTIYSPTTDEGAATVSSNWSSAWGMNSYSLLLQKGTATTGTPTVCDSRTDATCPSIRPKGWMSMYVQQRTSPLNTSDISIGTLTPSASKGTFEVTLFDPGEGGTSMQILNPIGAAAAAAGTSIPSNGYATFTYQNMGLSNSATGSASSPGTSMALSNSSSDSCWSSTPVGVRCSAVYEGKFVKLTITVPSDYATNTSYSSNSYEWKIRYNYPSGYTVIDRTTWLIGTESGSTTSAVNSPVRLVE